jgi:endonuclease/exonuclease/phosphatase family metal-dependent hydrolase
MGLIEKERVIQTDAVCKYISQNIPAEDPLLLVGDFNDWRGRVTGVLKSKLDLSEAFLAFKGNHARSFPSWFPISRLDRIYFRNLNLKSCERLIGKPWIGLSDHLPLIAEFTL